MACRLGKVSIPVGTVGKRPLGCRVKIFSRKGLGRASMKCGTVDRNLSDVAQSSLTSLIWFVFWRWHLKRQ